MPSLARLALATDLLLSGRAALLEPFGQCGLVWRVGQRRTRPSGTRIAGWTRDARRFATGRLISATGACFARSKPGGWREGSRPAQRCTSRTLQAVAARQAIDAFGLTAQGLVASSGARIAYARSRLCRDGPGLA